MPRFTGNNKPHRKDRAWTLAWSPEQTANWIRLDFPEDESMRISHEAIYQALYIQGRGALRRELVWCLRTGRALRAPRERSRRKTWAHVTPETLIGERPAEAADRAVPGHWEDDLLIGLESAIGTVVERSTRFDRHVPQGVRPTGPPIHGEEPLEVTRGSPGVRETPVCPVGRVGVATADACDERLGWLRATRRAKAVNAPSSILRLRRAVGPWRAGR